MTVFEDLLIKDLAFENTLFNFSEDLIFSANAFLWQLALFQFSPLSSDIGGDGKGVLCNRKS